MWQLVMKRKFYLSVLKYAEIDSDGDIIMVDESGLLYVEEKEYPVCTLKETEVASLRNAVRIHNAWHIFWKMFPTEEEQMAQLYINGDGRHLVFDYLVRQISGNIDKPFATRNKAFGTRDFAEHLGVKRNTANVILKWLRDMGYITYQRSWKEVTRQGFLDMNKELDIIEERIRLKSFSESTEFDDHIEPDTGNNPDLESESKHESEPEALSEEDKQYESVMNIVKGKGKPENEK